MEPQPGTKPEPQDEAPAGLTDSLARFLGFLAFAAPAVLILASLVLLPMYKHWVLAEHQAACDQTKVDERNLALDAAGRVHRDMLEDEVLNQRVLIAQSSLLPANLKEVEIPGLPPSSPTATFAPKLPLPPRPTGTLLQMADKLENPTTKRGLILVMLGAAVASIFLFGPPATKRP